MFAQTWRFGGGGGGGGGGGLEVSGRTKLIVSFFIFI